MRFGRKEDDSAGKVKGREREKGKKKKERGKEVVVVIDDDFAGIMG